MSKTDWNRVKTIMEKCVRGSVTILERVEEDTLRDAMREDQQRYRAMHAEVKAEADKGMRL